MIIELHIVFVDHDSGRFFPSIVLRPYAAHYV